jgi:DNA helicase INO80
MGSYENPKLTDIHPESTSFSFLRFIDTPTAEAHQIHVSPLLRRRLIAFAKTESSPDPYYAM